MRNNPIQFAVVREDPELEMELVEKHSVKKALLIASGGCTALSLKVRFPDLAITLLDPNPAQLDHVRNKARLLTQRAGLAAFNVGTNAPQGVNQRGNFESLFRGLREFLIDLVMPIGGMEALFTDESDPSSIEELTSHKYWPVAFDMFFSDPILLAMFGPEAVQNAPPGSYPRYFQAVFEEGLAREDFRDNYFLHHVLLGHYLDRPAAWPYYLKATWEKPPREFDFDYFEGFVHHRKDLDQFDLIDLSNIFDWMSVEEQTDLAHLLAENMKSGGVVVIRQLNNQRCLADLFGSTFVFDEDRQNHWRRTERSLFYSQYNIAVKQ